VLRVRLLGQFSVELDGESLTIRSRPAQSLLAYLILNAGVAHRRERVAGLLWPESAEANARGNLRHALWRVRKALGTCPQTGRSYIQADDLTVGLDTQADYWLDVAIVEREGEEGSTADALIEAVSVYGGELLPGFYDDWVTLERERLRAQFERRMQWLMDRLVEEERWSEVAERGEDWIALGNTPEPAYRALMVAHSALGDQSGVAAAYQRCVEALRQELDVEVSQQTRKLYQRLSGGEPMAADAVSRSDTHDGAASPRHNLPVQAIPFVGREAELTDIATCLGDPNCRLLTLVGPGGSGKTRLAIETGATRVDDFEHGVWFVPLAGVRSPGGLVPAIASALGFSFLAGGDPRGQLLSYLRKRELLLILDNLEHLLDGTEQIPDGASNLVTAIVEAAPKLKVLTTSRAALRVLHEQLYPVTGMAYPAQGAGRAGEDAARAAASYSAIVLFVQGARWVAPRFRLGADNVSEVIRICDLVTGMPLGILLASSWVRMLSPQQIVAQLKGNLDLLETDLRDVPARQRSMRAVFDHSWVLLSDRERTVMQALSICRGGFTFEAAQAVAGASLADVRMLVDRSLVQPLEGARYQIHELLRQYADEQLTQTPGELMAARDRHAAYFATALATWGEEFKGLRQRDALAEMDLDIDNARAAWDWAAQTAAVDHLARAVRGLGHYYYRRARSREGTTAFESGVAHLERAGKLKPGARALTLVAAAWMLGYRVFFRSYLEGRQERGSSLAEHGLALLRRPELGDTDTRSAEAFLCFVMGWVERALGSPGYRGWTERSLELARSVEDWWQIAASTSWLADMDMSSGDYAAARHKMQECIAIGRDMGDEQWIATSLIWLAWIDLLEGNVERGERRARESLPMLRRLRGPTEFTVGVMVLAGTLLYQGEFTESLALLRERKGLWAEQGASNTFDLWTLAWVEVRQGEWEGAKAHLLTAVDQARREGGSLVPALCNLELGRLAIRDGAYADAMAMLLGSIRDLEASVYRDWAARAHAACSHVARGLGDLGDARHHLTAALRWAADRKSFFALVDALPAAALLLLSEGKEERAVETYALACTLPAISKSVWVQDVVGKPIAQAAGTLPAAVVAAAQERGRARDMQETLEELISEWGE